MVVVKVDNELYDSDDKIKIEDSIRKILVKVDLEDIIKELYR